jgi:serine/threonine-protein kinase
VAATKADELVSYVATRLQLPKAAILGGAAAIALFVLVVAIVVARRDPSKGADGTVAKLLAGRDAASTDEIRAAAAKGPAALEELAAKYPKDPALLREIAFAYDAAGRSADALRVVRQMLEADPKGVPRDLVRVVIRAASKIESADEAFRLLEGPLGSDGVDALMELAENVEVPASTASRAQKSLTRPSVRANASPSTAFVLDLGAASTCDAKHEVLVRAGTQADARSLPALRALETKHGCGRRKRFDCNPCLRKDDALTRAIAAAQSSSAK